MPKNTFKEAERYPKKDLKTGKKDVNWQLKLNNDFTFNCILININIVY